jgi:hypothetical protein
MKQFFNSAFYAFFTLAGLVLELPSVIMFMIADLFYTENNEEENDEE